MIIVLSGLLGDAYFLDAFSLKVLSDMANAQWYVNSSVKKIPNIKSMLLSKVYLHRGEMKATSFQILKEHISENECLKMSNVDLKLGRLHTALL